MPDECEKLRQAHVRPSRESLIRAAHERAQKINQRLESTPGLSRAAIARELNVSRARVTQMLRRFQKPHQIPLCLHRPLSTSE